MKSTTVVLAMGLVLAGAACKKNDAVVPGQTGTTADNTGATTPGTRTTTSTGTTGTTTETERARTDLERARLAEGQSGNATGRPEGVAPTAAEAARDNAAAGAHPAVTGTAGLNVAETPAYGNCMTIVDRMRACAKDPGFKKYQGRWTKKGAPAAGSRDFGKRILGWNDEAGRRSQCESWTKRKEAELHLGEKSKLAETLKDAKLSCTSSGKNWTTTVGCRARSTTGTERARGRRHERRRAATPRAREGAAPEGRRLSCGSGRALRRSRAFRRSRSARRSKGRGVSDPCGPPASPPPPAAATRSV